MTSMRRKSNLFETTKQIRYLNMSVHHKRICFFVVNNRSLRETLSYESHFISCDFIFFITPSYKYSFISNKFDNFKHLDYRSKILLIFLMSLILSYFHFDQSFLCWHSSIVSSLGSSLFLMMSITTWKENMLLMTRVFQSHFSPYISR